MEPPKYHVATKCMRSNSPYAVKKTENQRDVAKGNKFSLENRNKIHRILLNSFAEVEFINLVSPSCIWVRLLNHVNDDVDLKAPYPLMQAIKFDNDGSPIQTSIREYDYYMAPRLLPGNRDENDDGLVYSRARLIRIGNLVEEDGTHIYCYVHYIDYGFGNWVRAECLGVMPKHLFTRPWQAIPVSLMGVSPVESFDIERKRWTQKQCSILREILNKYKRFVAEPFVCKYHTIQDYNSYARVELKALVDYEEEMSENEEIDLLEDLDRPAQHEKHTTSYKPNTISINYEFFSESKRQGEAIRCNSHFDELTNQNLFGVERGSGDDYEIPSLTENSPYVAAYCRFPPNSMLRKTEEEIAADKQVEKERREQREKDELLAREDEEMRDQLKEEKKKEQEQSLWEWDCTTKNLDTLTPQVPKIPSKKSGDKLCVILSSASLNSPYDFYGHLLQPQSATVQGCHQAMLDFYAELDKWQAKLNDFYLNSANCKKFDIEDIRDDLNAGKSVYAIMCKFDHLEQSNFVRVKIVRFVNMNNLVGNITFCDVRLLDHGGTFTINMDTLLRMHSEHAVKPPLSIQMCLHGIVSASPAENNIPITTQQWTPEEQDQFQRLTPTDSPVECYLVRIWEEETDDIFGAKPSYQSDQTHFVENLRLVSGSEEESIEERMVKKEAAIWGQCPFE